MAFRLRSTFVYGLYSTWKEMSCYPPLIERLRMRDLRYATPGRREACKDCIAVKLHDVVAPPFWPFSVGWLWGRLEFVLTRPFISHHYSTITHSTSWHSTQEYSFRLRAKRHLLPMWTAGFQTGFIIFVKRFDTSTRCTSSLLYNTPRSHVTSSSLRPA